LRERNDLAKKLSHLNLEADSTSLSLDELRSSYRAKIESLQSSLKESERVATQTKYAEQVMRRDLQDSFVVKFKDLKVNIVTLESSLKSSELVASKAKKAEQRLREELQHSITNLNVLQNNQSEIVASEVEKMSAILWGEIKEGVTGLATDSEELTANISASFNTLFSNGCTVADVFDGIQQVLTHMISVNADAISNKGSQLTSVTSRSARRSSAIQGLKEELKVEIDKSAEQLAEMNRLDLAATASSSTIVALREELLKVQETASLAATTSNATIKTMREELQLIQDTASLEIVDLKKGFAAVSSTSVTQQKVISDYAVELQSEKEVSAGLVASFNDLKVELDSKVDACSDLTTTLGKAQESLTAANVSVAAFQKECEILSAKNNTLSEKLSSMSLLIKGNDDQKTDFSKRLGVLSIEVQTATREIGVLKSKLTLS
jgi:chromosome segregation ATPase